MVDRRGKRAQAMKRPSRLLLAALAACVGLATVVSPAAAEVFRLANGGQIEGEWLNRDEAKPEKYIVGLPSGGKITLEASRVKEIVAQRPEEAEYEKIRPQYPDTPQGQWDLAKWCEEHKLSSQQKAHLKRVIQLDPNHADARHALGYSQIDGQWTTQEESMTKQGYRKYKGRWRTAQEIEILEKKRKTELAEKDWYQKIKRWRSWLGGSADQQARENIAGIADPAAVKALATDLRDDKEPADRLLYVEALAKIEDPAAPRALAIDAIDDPVEEVRLTSLDHLEKTKNAEVVGYFVSRLDPKKSDNVHVNRAGVALGRMKDPSAVGPLINALITTHKFQVNTGNPGSMSTTFNKNTPSGSGAVGGMGGMGFGTGGNQPKMIQTQFMNQSVLDALAVLTGQNFGFNRLAWHAWFNAQKKNEAVNARRD